MEWHGLIAEENPELYKVIDATMTNSDRAYIIYMAIRLLEMRRILKSTGSIYLHCDPTMSHYLKLVMDAVFGPTHYRSEISWKRSSAHNDGNKGVGYMEKLEMSFSFIPKVKMGMESSIHFV